MADNWGLALALWLSAQLQLPLLALVLVPRSTVIAAVSAPGAKAVEAPSAPVGAETQHNVVGGPTAPSWQWELAPLLELRSKLEEVGWFEITLFYSFITLP